MFFSEREREASDTAMSPSTALEKGAERGTGELVAAPSREPPGAEEEEDNHGNRPVALVHLQQNFGIMSRVLEREVFRRGLINSSVADMYSSFFLMSGVLMDILRSEIDQRILHVQLLEMLFSVLEPTYGVDHTRMLVVIMERSADDLFLFQALLSSTSLDALVQRAQEYMNPPARSAGSSLSGGGGAAGGGGVSGNYGSVPNENVRGVQTSYNNTSAAVRPSYADFNKERRSEQAVEPNLPRGLNTYTEGSSVPASSQQEEDVMPTVTSGWAATQRKHVEHDHEVTVHHHHHHHHHHLHHHHHHHHIQHRAPFNQYLHQSRHQIPNVAQHHQVVVGSGPMGLQQPQQQESPRGDSFSRVPPLQGSQKRVMDRLPQNTQEPEDSHPRGPMWRGLVHSSGSQQEIVVVSQPSFPPQNSPPTPTPTPTPTSTPAPAPHGGYNPHHHHHIVSPNSPTHTRLLVQHRHTSAPFLPSAPMGKQPPNQPTPQVTPQVTSTVNTMNPLPGSQRIMVHHHHDLPIHQPTISRVSPPPHPGYSTKQEPVVQSETKQATHNVETTAQPLRPYFHHHISSHHLKILRQPSSQPSAPASVGGDTPSHGPVVPAHHHSVHQFQQNRPSAQQQHQYRQPTSSAPAPISIDALSDEEMNWTSQHTVSMPSSVQELRCFLRDRSVPEAVIIALVKTSLTIEELIAIPRELFDERLKEIVSVHHRQFVWNVLHPKEKPLSEKDMPEMSELRNFINNNAIHNNMTQEAEDENASSKRGQPSKTMLQLPQPRTSQSKQQQQQTGKGVEYNAVIWLSGVNSWDIHSVLEEVSKYGKVIQHGTSSQKTDLIYCKLKDHKNDLQTVRKIGGAVVEEYYRVSPRDVTDGAPSTPTCRTEEIDDNDTSKVRQRPGGSVQLHTQHHHHHHHHHHHQQQQHSFHRSGYGEGDEEENDGEENRNHRKGVRHTRGRGRGGHHNYHHHRHTDGSSQVICKFFSKGICKFGDQCQFFHPQKYSNRS